MKKFFEWYRRLSGPEEINHFPDASHLRGPMPAKAVNIKWGEAKRIGGNIVWSSDPLHNIPKDMDIQSVKSDEKIIIEIVD